MLDDRQLAPVLLELVRGVTGGQGGTVTTLAGDASTRRYHRVRVAGGDPATAIVMELPADAHASDEKTGDEAPVELPFLNVQRYLREGGVPVPGVLRADLKLGLIVLEDLGDRTFEAEVKEATPGQRRQLYRRAIDEIVQIQRLGQARPDPSCIAFRRRFDKALLRWELDHFREWLLEADRGVKLSGDEAAILDRTFDWLAGTLERSPPFLVHRDFQSRNLMVTKSDEPFRVIDFQDALMGPRAYDLVALLRDSYVELEPAEVLEQIEAFIEAAAIDDGDDFRRLFWRQTLQRKLKDAGRFVFIDRVRKNPSFLRWIPASLRYVRDALARVPEARDLRLVLARHVPELS